MTDRRQRHEDFIKERRKGDERRAHPRERVAITMELTAGNDLYFHVSGDLSQGGAFFNRAIPHPIGTEVDLTFQLPGSESAPIRCHGEVVNIPEGGEGLGMGVRFLDLSDEDRERVDSFVARVAEHRSSEEGAAEGGGPGDGAAP